MSDLFWLTDEQVERLRPFFRRATARLGWMTGEGIVKANAPAGKVAQLGCGMLRPCKPASPFRYFNSSPEVIRLVVLMYVRFPLSLRNVEDLLFKRGIDICHETVRLWWNRFGPMFAGDIRRQRVSRMRGFRHWRWHLDEMYVKLNGQMVYLWRAVDHEGEVLESYVTRTRDKKAALSFMHKALKRHGTPEAITTDGLRSYGAAMDELGNRQKQEIGRWANNRVEGIVKANALTGKVLRLSRVMPRPRKPASPFRYFNSSPEVIRLVVLMYVRFPLSLRNVEDLLFERGIDICHETVRLWWNRFGPMFAGDIRRQRVSRMRGFRHWRWHLDEMYVKLNGEMVYLWRAVDHEGEVLESYVTRTRDKKAALSFMRKALKRHGAPKAITTDGLRSYGAAMDELGNREKQEIGRWANNRVENSHLPFRRRERAMNRFRRMSSLQKFASVHASIHNHFSLERHLTDRQTYKERRSAALAEWQILAS